VIASSTSVESISFKYDPFGRRIYKSSSSGTSVYAYDGDNLVEETNATGAVVARYEDTQNIDEPLAMLRSGATSYYHADGLGSVTSLSSSAGSIANTYIYDSFGKLTASTGSLVNPFRYTARESENRNRPILLLRQILSLATLMAIRFKARLQVSEHLVSRCSFIPLSPRWNTTEDLFGPRLDRNQRFQLKSGRVISRVENDEIGVSLFPQCGQPFAIALRFLSGDEDRTIVRCY
jgi:hypothetical protein